MADKSDSFNSAPRYLIGIDLGTTHTVAACADLSLGARARIELFPIEQSIKPGEVAARLLLPFAEVDFCLFSYASKVEPCKSI